MTGTLGALYQDSGINAQVQAELRHFASRVDAHTTWQSDFDFYSANPGLPDAAAQLARLNAAGEPEVPDFGELARLTYWPAVAMTQSSLAHTSLMMQ